MAKLLLVKNCEIDGRPRFDILCDGPQIKLIQPHPISARDCDVLDACGGAVIPALVDQHIHLLSLAATSYSVKCGPPEINSMEELILALKSAPGNSWIRGIGYHESVAGDLTERKLDSWITDRPVKIQHRSGKLWALNSPAKRELQLSRESTNQIFRNDEVVRTNDVIDEELKDSCHQTSRQLASYGIGTVVDATHTNDRQTVEQLERLFPFQRVHCMGNEELAHGELKVMLDEAALGEFKDYVDAVRRAHDNDRGVAFHCITRVEIVFALNVLRDAGIHPQDRIEHASETDEGTLHLLKETGVRVVTQPSLLFERGDQYRQDLPPEELSMLYRVRSFLEFGIDVSFSSDAPFGNPDPWIGMATSVSRTTRDGHVVGGHEAIGSDTALDLYLKDPGDAEFIRVREDEPADLCILKRPLNEITAQLSSNGVRYTVKRGEVVFKSDNA